MTEEESQASSEDTSEESQASSEDTSEESTETIETEQQSFAAEKAIKADTPKNTRPSTPDPEDEGS